MGEKFGMIYSVLSTYYIGATIACIAGLYEQGQLREALFNLLLVATYVCKGLIENKPPDMELDLDQCLDWYKKTAAAMVVFLGITCLIDLHFCMAVWAYYQKLKVEKQYDNIPENGYIVYYTPIPAYTVSLPPSYESVPQDDFKKSHIPKFYFIIYFIYPNCLIL
ncbi:9151_t:CDS:2 [Diversispora eburnea]|uniref:9151_t:CDS:1 n=1 Tax=Diversispora eburnea TaxID=1213867 RepID=A0A9N9FQI4_9GLOM|nr:9151_t:CDS:2 [Diversispora eburnea]